ncbi:MAG: aromatic ring-hydroxylating dioxygenase subunit alpha [Actinobacteria bacterium]|nr:aromatic ring-hydroxylating dioxygenase subunit alpha [Actinomycetota bacterium]
MTSSLTNLSSGLAAAWHPVLFASDLAHTSVRIDLLGEPWVITRLDGSITAFIDKCPHRNARLSDGMVVGDTLQCPYHGWRFDGSGHCTLIPALGDGATVPPTAQLTSAHVVERYGLIWIAPQTPVTEIIEIPEWDDESLHKVWMPAIDINATAAQFIDNFLDFGHFPFVHAGTFGSGEDANIGDYNVDKTDSGWGFVVDYPHTIANKEDPLVATGQHPLVQPRNMVYTFQAPFSANLRLELPLTGVVNAIATFCQPMTASTTRLYTVMMRSDGATAEAAQAALQYEYSVLQEDLAVIEHLYDNQIALGVGQAHSRADRSTVEFRRILARLLEH